VSVARFDRTGELVAMGDDLRGRPDAVEFIARSGEPTSDWLAEVTVTISGWATRAGVATLYELQAGAWVPLRSAMPFDAVYVKANTPVRLTFSSYIPLQPAGRYRLFMPGALVSSPTIQIAALLKPRELARRSKWEAA
jgi:hypothetical protein